MIPALDIPPLALTNAMTEPEWDDLPLRRGIYRRHPSLRLPLDPRTAAATRRYRRLAPWSLPLNLVALILYWVTLRSDHLPFAVQLAALGFYPATVFWWHRLSAGLPRQHPQRLRSGDLRIRDVPVEVAEQWVVRNPGVTTTDEPMPLPHSRRYYARWSIGLVTAAIALFVTLANDGREDNVLLWMLSPILFVAGVVTALKTLPRPRGEAKYTLLG